MGGDVQFESLVQLINNSKPIKIGLFKNINNFARLALVWFERLILLNRPRKLSKPVVLNL
ncbi:hypothetical protein DWB61_17505 [Ancylomarina euxinus]|uniref:Uncharacterized protein n=1 Tax=Ancylomarina euxinus TaxID=2283627 RepID=A0A425XWE8_9BACT|nr:hypothetical protein DWB61_17505 [Ancylomarina euxinus]